MQNIINQGQTLSYKELVEDVAGDIKFSGTHYELPEATKHQLRITYMNTFDHCQRMEESDECEIDFELMKHLTNLVSDEPGTVGFQKAARELHARMRKFITRYDDKISDDVELAAANQRAEYDFAQGYGH